MTFTIDSSHGLYAAADTAEQAVQVLGDHLRGLLGVPDIDYLIVAPDGRYTSGTLGHWERNPTRTLARLLDEITADFTTTTRR